MSDREKIFSSVRKALEPLKERAAYPQWQTEDVLPRQDKSWSSPWAEFSERLIGLGGIAFDTPKSVTDFLRGKEVRRGYCDPALLPVFAPFADGLEIVTEFVRAEVDTYAFGITKATGIIIESGTIVLSDRDTPDRLAALAPWIHIACVREADFYPTLPAAIGKLGDDPSVIWATGPSKTADVEGILIKGVHGPGEQGAVVI